MASDANPRPAGRQEFAQSCPDRAERSGPARHPEGGHGVLRSRSPIRTRMRETAMTPNSMRFVLPLAACALVLGVAIMASGAGDPAPQAPAGKPMVTATSEPSPLAVGRVRKSDEEWRRLLGPAAYH